MAYSDPSDKILKWENGDVVTPLAAKMNMHLDSVGLVTNKITRDGVYKVLNIPERTALVNTIGTTNISAANPLLVWRANADVGKRLEYTENGGNWHYVRTSQDYEEVVVVDFAYNSFVKPYGAGGSDVIPRLYREGNWVFFAGAFSPLQNNIFDGGKSEIVGTVPVGMRPVQSSATKCQGSGSDSWFLAVNPQGVVNVGRYSGNQTTGTWLPFATSWRTP